MTVALDRTPLEGVERARTLAQLQARIAGMQDGVPRVPLATHPALAGLLQLRTGGVYEVDNASLMMALLGPPTQAGGWAAVVGVRDFGIEAAAGLGADLTRILVVPDPGEQWLEVTAALVDVVTLVVLCPPPRVTAAAASRIAARLRKRSAALVVWGRWPGSEARLELESSVWSGADRGRGRLCARQLRVALSRGSAPVRRVDLDLRDDTGLQCGRPAARLDGLPVRQEVG